ncbi:hypothetical protein JW916_15370 [Candidatus Sumerlaeota bacterium]|nr:hypothetical protein [Candidatus Sumerlaeota bacterium]
MYQRTSLAAILICLAVFVAAISPATLAQDEEAEPPEADATSVAPVEAEDASPTGGFETEIRRTAEGVPLVSTPFIKPTPIMIVLDDFRAQTGLRVSVQGKKVAEAQVTISGEDLTPEEFLTLLAAQNNLRWRKKGDAYEIMDEEYWNTVAMKELTETKIFIPVHVTALYFNDALGKAGVLSPVGSASLDERSNQVIVTDLPEKLAMVQDLLNLIDVPQVLRVFRVRYGDINSISAKVQEFLSSAGSIETDERNRMIVVRDSLANIQRMESIVELLDVRQLRKVYNLNISKTQDDLKALQDVLALIATPGERRYYIDGSRGMLWLEDTPEVHLEVEKFLQVFDRPVEQVLIQAELLDVNQGDLLSYGTEISYSGDLAAAVQDHLISNYPTIGGAAGSSSGSPYGFIDYRKEFPLGSIGSGGLAVGYLSRHVKAQLSAALTSNNTRVLLKPRFLVKSGEEAKIFSGTQDPVPDVQPLSSDSNQYSVSQSYVESGLTVSITPTISPTGLVTIKLRIENSSAEQVSLATGVTNIPTFTGIRKLEDSADTVLMIPDGETRVISGLIRRNRSEKITGVPFLVKIPWIGPLLFGANEKNDSVRNLLFFITPTILRERPAGSPVALNLDDTEPLGRWMERDETLGAPPSLEGESLSTGSLTTSPLFSLPWDANVVAPEAVAEPPAERFLVPTPIAEPESTIEGMESILELPETESDEETTTEEGRPTADESVPDSEEGLARFLTGREATSGAEGAAGAEIEEELKGIGTLRIGPSTSRTPPEAPPSDEPGDSGEQEEAPQEETAEQPAGDAAQPAAPTPQPTPQATPAPARTPQESSIIRRRTKETPTPTPTGPAFLSR